MILTPKVKEGRWGGRMVTRGHQSATYNSCFATLPANCNSSPTTLFHRPVFIPFGLNSPPTKPCRWK